MCGGSGETAWRSVSKPEQNGRWQHQEQDKSKTPGPLPLGGATYLLFKHARAAAAPAGLIIKRRRPGEAAQVATGRHRAKAGRAKATHQAAAVVAAASAVVAAVATARALRDRMGAKRWSGTVGGSKRGE